MGATHQRVTVENSLTFHWPLNSFHWPFINEKQSMFTFALAFFLQALLFFSSFSTPFRFWLDFVCKAFEFANKFPDSSLTLTTSKIFADFLRNSLTLPWLWKIFVFPWPWQFWGNKADLSSVMDRYTKFSCQFKLLNLYSKRNFRVMSEVSLTWKYPRHFWLLTKLQRISIDRDHSKSQSRWELASDLGQNPPIPRNPLRYPQTPDC